MKLIMTSPDGDHWMMFLYEMYLEIIPEWPLKLWYTEVNSTARYNADIRFIMGVTAGSIHVFAMGSPED